MKVQWLKNKPQNRAGVTWGVPWKKGSLKREDSISLKNSQGTKTSLQSWPMAFWPDGSVKWTGHAAILPNQEDLYDLEVDENSQTDHPLQVKEFEKTILIDTGKIQVSINKQGTSLINKITDGFNIIGVDGKLIAIHEERSKSNGIKQTKEMPLHSQINDVEIEQAGPIRCVIKMQGKHQPISGECSWLPFIVRLYFYADTSEIRVVHTFFYNGDPEKDFIKGLGLEFSVPLTGESWNRNVRFAGDEGLFSEPAQLLLTRRHRNAEGLYQKQIDGGNSQFK